MKTLWDSSYDSEEFVYGKEPNGFFASQLGKLKPGSLLLPGEGEGRNAIHAASRAWKVEAFDQSLVAAKKARAFAAEKHVSLDYSVSVLEAFHISQLGNNTGGPNIPEFLFTEEIIRTDFSGLEILRLEQLSVRLEEGTFHQGEAEVIHYVGRKTR